MGLMDMLNQALGGQQQGTQFNQVAQNAPSDVLAKGLAAAFNSDQTPDIGAMVSQLFGQSNGTQQAGMLNQLLGTLGPGVMAGLGGGALAGILKPGQTQITPSQASKLTPQQVQEVVNHADDIHPGGVADQLGAFYAQHRGLINTLGGVAATVAMMKMKDHISQG
ncbi:MAG TPA: hypothetical protein VMN79_08455 [Casimicrobiaceae bacterium]|nr:hypothetical protein [Casimicrobiaceae bacterium]